MHDLVEHSEAAGDIVQGDEVGGAMLRLRAFMFENVYLGPIGAGRARARSSASCAGCSTGSASTRRSSRAGGRRRDEADRVIDYLAGMTDRFAIRAWTERAVPQGLLV